MNQFTVERTDENVLCVKFDEVAAGWEQWVMLSSDRHHDNLWCKRGVEKRHLDQAKEREALIVDAGDLFCAMQGKYDPRSSMDNIRPEDVGEDYLDRIVSHAYEFYEPYAEHVLLMGRGNHETNIRRRHGHDLTSNLVYRLNAESAADAHVGGYGGWIKFFFKMNKTKSQSQSLRYYHGKSSRAPVTRGVIQTNRQAVYLPDADLVLNGHNHEAYHVPIARERVTQAGKLSRDVVDFVRTPGYNDGYRRGQGFDVEKGSPKPIGCAWVRFYYNPTTSKIDREIVLSVQ